jgi:DNA-binding transcriptional LysR family regulator
MTSRRLPDLEDLALLVSIARCGSIGRAAIQSGLTQPHVSRRMRALERGLNVAVLERSHTGTALTPVGRVLVGWAEKLLASAEEFDQSVASLRAEADAAVVVGVSMTIAEHLAPRWLGSLRRTLPAATVSLTVCNSADVVDAVLSRRAVLGFVESPTVPSTLSSRRVGRDVLAIAVAPGHPWERRTAIPVSELAATPLLVREPGSGTRETIEHALGQRGHVLTPALELASNTALTSAAATGLGPVVLSELSIADELRTRRLVRVEVLDLDLSRYFTAVWRPDVDLPGSARALLAVATED